MEIILIRHGEPDYGLCEERAFIGHGKDLAPLTKRGVSQAEQVAMTETLKSCQLIVASPYTRAMQTAAIITRTTGIPLTVEMDLREWQPDSTYQYQTSDDAHSLYADFKACKGVHPIGVYKRWESIEQLTARVDPVIRRYYNAGYQKIMVVAHGEVISRFTGISHVKHCTPYSVNYEDDYCYYGCVEE